MKEAWVINRIIYVSPAIFQLLTDEDDPEMMNAVAQQLQLRSASYAELEALAKDNQQKTRAWATQDIIVHFPWT